MKWVKVATEILIKKIKRTANYRESRFRNLPPVDGRNHLILPERRRSRVSRTLTPRRLSPLKTGFCL